MPNLFKKYLTPALITVAVVAVAAYAWTSLRGDDTAQSFYSGNGRIEATEIDLATKLGGRLRDILVREGEFVEAGQLLAHMQIDSLEAQRAEAEARRVQTVSAVDSTQAMVAMRRSDIAAATSVVAQRESELDAARRRLARSETLAQDGASSEQELDDDRARERSYAAALAASRAQLQAVRAAHTAAVTQVAGAQATVNAAEATVARIQTEIDDSALVAPRAGRVQYVVAQAGEVLGGGGKVLNMVDLSEVHMTFFVPETLAGRLAVGSEVRIKLDAAPDYVVPARLSFVASTAQFTPKTVETESERQKLMFRVKAQIDRELLQKHLQQVKTGLPGVAWIKLDADTPWPPELTLKTEP